MTRVQLATALVTEALNVYRLGQKVIECEHVGQYWATAVHSVRDLAKARPTIL